MDSNGSVKKPIFSDKRTHTRGSFDRASTDKQSNKRKDIPHDRILVWVTGSYRMNLAICGVTNGFVSKLETFKFTAYIYINEYIYIVHFIRDAVDFKAAHALIHILTFDNLLLKIFRLPWPPQPAK